MSTFASAQTLTVKHALGTTAIDATPKRVVVIGFGALDTLDYFGITTIAVSKGLN